MAKHISAQKPEPRRELQPSETDKAWASVAATALMNGFSWADHPWGDAFWTVVHDELHRIAESD